jgi:hypothetical protein
MKIRLVGAELFHADGRTGRQTDRHDEANRSFSQFGKASKSINREIADLSKRSHANARSYVKKTWEHYAEENVWV